MKNYFLLALCASLFFAGCEKDDGFRAVQVEIELGAVPIWLNNPTGGYTNYASGEVRLESSAPAPEIVLELPSYSAEGDSQKTLKSEEVIWAVGTNVSRYVSIQGSLDGATTILPCDVTVRIKADDKVIWSHAAKKGDGRFFEMDANLIIR